ncbi:hypothetical protein CKC_03950 [Candidatus Liberibacter solanacearum CLso-ZC1]|uniref:Uncharacterized protein n=1 Tax=Liberibacter solanacearum (strain CLso-ZC1) TaxID=658172 RepID=E4UB60_LIBSC|nr:hypothetical protein CKC_03950 [Candidatus Liberibacter solanacearum CLso-ZC1]
MLIHLQIYSLGIFLLSSTFYYLMTIKKFIKAPVFALRKISHAVHFYNKAY